MIIQRSLNKILGPSYLILSKSKILIIDHNLVQNTHNHIFCLFLQLLPPTKLRTNKSMPNIGPKNLSMALQRTTRNFYIFSFQFIFFINISTCGPFWQFFSHVVNAQKMEFQNFRPLSCRQNHSHTIFFWCAHNCVWQI